MSDPAKQSQSTSKAAEELQASFRDLYSHFATFRSRVYRVFSKAYVDLAGKELLKKSQKKFQCWASEACKTGTYRSLGNGPVGMVLHAGEILLKDQGHSIPDAGTEWLDAVLALPQYELLEAVEEWETSLPKLLSQWPGGPVGTVRGSDSWAVTGIVEGENFAVTYKSGQLRQLVEACLKNMNGFLEKGKSHQSVSGEMPKEVGEFSTANVYKAFERLLQRYERDTQEKRGIMDAGTDPSGLSTKPPSASLASQASFNSQEHQCCHFSLA
jgi:hypothetical protein